MKHHRNKAFGTLLRHARERAGKSQTDVARFLRCSGPFVSDVELGKRAPLVRPKIHEVARFLDTKPDGLIVAAAQWHGVYELPMDLDRLHDDVGAALSARWESLTEEQLCAILEVLEGEEP